MSEKYQDRTDHSQHQKTVLFVPYMAEQEQRILWCRDCNQKIQALTEQEFNDWVSDNH